MSDIYTQTDTAAPLGVIQACAPVAPAGDADAVEASIGGTAGVTALACAVANASSELCFATELNIADDTSLDSGTLTFRLNVSTAQADLTLEEIYVCRVASDGTSQETLGSVTGLGTDISAGGVFSQNISLSAASAHNAGDKVYITVVVANAHSHTSRTIEVLPDQDVDTPFVAAAAGQTLTPDPAVAAFSAPDPSLTLGALTVSPDAVSAAWGAAAPSLTVGAVTLTPDSVAAALTTPAPSLNLGGLTASPDPATAAWGVPDPTVSEGGEQVVSPDPATATWGSPSATLSLGELALAPSPVAAMWSVAAPSLAAGPAALTPDPARAAWGVPAPNVSGGGGGGNGPWRAAVRVTRLMGSLSRTMRGGGL